MISEQQELIKMVNELPFEKIGMALKAIKWVNTQNNVVSLEPHELEEIMQIMNEDEWTSNEEMRELIDGMVN